MGKITKNDARATIKESGVDCTVGEMHDALNEADRNRKKRLEIERIYKGLSNKFLGVGL